MTNPTSGADKADANGWFPQVYAAEAGTFDILLKDAGGSTIASYLSVVSLGSNTGTLTRDFTTSRGAMRGSGGSTYFEAGDPTGDDVGGTGVNGGWLGTQADLWTINAALFNVVGRIKENSKKLPGVVYTDATTFSGASTVDIALPNDPTGVLVWAVEVINLTASATAPNLQLRFSYDNGVTYVSTSTYHDAINMAAVTTNSASGSPTAADHAEIAIGFKSPANTPGAIFMRVVTPNSGANATLAMGKVAGWDNVGPEPKLHDFVAYDSTGGRATHVRLFASSGTLSGTYRVVPQRGFGDT